MLFAQRTDPAYSLILSVTDGPDGAVTGLAPTVRIRDGATVDSYLDFADATFKVSGHTTLEATMAEIGNGHYEYDLDIAGITGIAARTSLVAEYHVEDGGLELDQSAVVVLQQLTGVGLTLTVNDLGGIEGLSPTVRVRDTPSNTRFLDWSDGVFKAVGWGLRDAPMADVGRGHYHRHLDYESLSPIGLAVVAEYSVDNGISVIASDRLQALHDVGATEDVDPPLVTNIDPPPNGLSLYQTITMDVLDETGLRFGALLVSADRAALDEWVYDGSRFGRGYSGSVTEVDGNPNHLRFSFFRRHGWPAGDRLRFRIIAFDTSGNRVEVEA